MLYGFLFCAERTRVPWHRVINSAWTISPRGDNGVSAARQAERLQAEGVEVHQGRMGEWRISSESAWDITEQQLEELLDEEGPN